LAFGDFDASPNTTDSVTSDEHDRRLAFPSSTLTVSAEASVDRSSERFSGVSTYGHGPTLPLLLWPSGRECELRPSTDPARVYPAPGGGQGIGHSPELSLLMLAGSDAGQSAAVTAALTFHTGTGSVDLVPPGQAQLREPRAYASVTAFGPGFLVAGGEDPTVTFASGRRRLLDSAEIYDAESGRFDQLPAIDLRVPRTRHRAVALDADTTLLVGGRTASAAGEEQGETSLELIEYTTREVRHVGRLSVARISPSVVELSDGSLFVAGGYDLAGDPVPGAEWLRGSVQGGFDTERFEPELFTGRLDQDFVAMPGGAVLAVGGCEARTAGAAECAMCRAGCRPEAGWDAFWISGAGELGGERQVVRFELGNAAPRPRLIPAPDAAPLLIANAVETADEDSHELLRFDPWAQRFEVIGRLEHAPRANLPQLNLDAGAAVWVTDDGPTASLFGRRYSTRHALAQDLELISLVSSTNALWPLHLAPGQGAADPSAPGARLVPRNPGGGGDFVLELGDGASVWVTDTRYADFDLNVTLESGPPPQLLLDAPHQACAWPADSERKPRVLQATRRGSCLELESGSERARCNLGTGRIALGFRAGPEATRLSALRVWRSAR